MGGGVRMLKNFEISDSLSLSLSVHSFVHRLVRGGSHTSDFTQHLYLLHTMHAADSQTLDSQSQDFSVERRDPIIVGSLPFRLARVGSSFYSVISGISLR